MLNLFSILQAVFLLLVANGAPIMARHVFGPRCGWPLDLGVQAWDRRDWLGPSKTIRGLLASVLLTALAAFLLGQPLVLGAMVGFWAMTGDALSSFIKRRLGFASSVSVIGLDQSLEALIPVWVLRGHWDFDVREMTCVVLLFVALDIVLSQILYRLGVRRHPR